MAHPRAPLLLPLVAKCRRKACRMSSGLANPPLEGPLNYLIGFCGKLQGFWNNIYNFNLSDHMCTSLGWEPIVSSVSKEDPDPAEAWKLGPTQGFRHSGTPGDTAGLPETLAPVSSLSSLSHELKSPLSLQVLAALSALHMAASGNHTFLKKTSNKPPHLEAKKGSGWVPTANVPHLHRAYNYLDVVLVRNPLKILQPCRYARWAPSVPGRVEGCDDLRAALTHWESQRVLLEKSATRALFSGSCS